MTCCPTTVGVADETTEAVVEAGAIVSVCVALVSDPLAAVTVGDPVCRSVYLNCAVEAPSGI